MTPPWRDGFHPVLFCGRRWRDGFHPVLFCGRRWRDGFHPVLFCGRRGSRPSMGRSPPLWRDGFHPVLFAVGVEADPPWGDHPLSGGTGSTPSSLWSALEGRVPPRPLCGRRGSRPSMGRSPPLWRDGFRPVLFAVGVGGTGSTPSSLRSAWKPTLHGEITPSLEGRVPPRPLCGRRGSRPSMGSSYKEIAI
ncbi:hypothetical protein L21SP4_02382 [Kiritimatiella glycovorans]|uniref:Uncharacterized protein n=1 Tax=Kiritimatiella glycovorans TaxID=1307763 RepID=A0A0G3EJI2_9BACT|nr:hypothetical protein L21SP4_02382 [Kiritimatiella glycovorans]